MTLRIKIKMGRKSIERLSLFLIFLVSSSLLFSVANSQEDSNTTNSLNTTNLALIFLIVVILLNVLTIVENPLTDFLINNYKFVVIILVIGFSSIYIIPNIPIGSITGFFVRNITTPSTIITTIQTTTTISEGELAEETITPLTETTTTTTTTETTTPTTTTSTTTTTTTTTFLVSFNRRLDCHKCGQHKAPPLTGVNMTISAIVSKPVQNTYLIDYYPVDWMVTNLNGGQTSSFNSSYNKIQWSIGSVDDSVTIWYVVKSPQRTSPPTDYYFFSEMESQQSDTWRVKVADPTEDLEQPYDCDDANVDCTETTVTISYPDGSKMMVNYQKPVNYFNDSVNQWEAVDPTLESTDCTINYDYCVVKGVYEAHFKNDPTLAETVRYFYNSSRKNEKPHKTGYVLYQPFSLNYRNDWDQIQQINKTLEVTGVPVSNKFTYPNIFGNGYNVSYEYLPDKIKETLILLNKNLLPPPEQWITIGPNLTLDFDFLIDFSDTVDIYIDGEVWDKKKTKTTSNRVDFKDPTTGDVLFYLPKPYAQDFNETNVSQQPLTYQFKKTGGKLYTVIKTPYSWLNDSARVYPVTIDPTINIDYNTTIDHYSINNTLNDYFFNITSTQNIDDILDYWAKNNVCLGLYFGNVWHEFCGDSLDWIWYNSTNFTTYMNLTGTADLEYAGYNVNARVEYYIGEDYPEVRGNVNFENVGYKDISDSYIKINTHDIRVNLTYDNDTFRVNTTSFWEAWSGWKQYFLDQSSLDLFYTENDLATRKYVIFDNATESWVEMEWNNSYWKNGISNSMNYNLTVKKGSETNAPIDLVFLTGSFDKNDVISTNFRWSDAIKQNFTESMKIFENYGERFIAMLNDAYVNGTQYYLQDFNMSIEVKSGNNIHVIENVFLTPSAYELITDMFMSTAWKFECFQFPTGDSYNTIRCPENQTTVLDIHKSFAEQEIQLKERNTSVSYSIPYLLLNNETGVLDNYTILLGSNGYNFSSVENPMFRRGRVKLPSLFDIVEPKTNLEFDVNYPTVQGPSYCVIFPIPRYANLTINVTMPYPISNYTFGISQFIIENYTIGNSVIARIKPYPCCGVTEVGLQPAEVCSV